MGVDFDHFFSVKKSILITFSVSKIDSRVDPVYACILWEIGQVPCSLFSAPHSSFVVLMALAFYKKPTMAQLASKPLFTCVWNRAHHRCRDKKRKILRSNLVTTQPSLVTVAPAPNSLTEEENVKGDSSTTSLSEEILRVFNNPGQTTLTLRDFVSHSEPRDALMLNGIVALNLPRAWSCIRLVDSVHGDNYRRWAFKKIGILKKVLTTATDQDIDLVFETKVHCSNMSWATIVSLLLELRKDPDVTTLDISGTFCYEGAEQIVQTLVGMVACDDRSWHSIHFHITVLKETDESREYPESHRVMAKCKRALDRLSAERDIAISIHIVMM